MASFEDGNGRKWNVLITLGTVEKIIRECDVNLFKVFDNHAELLARLHGDHILLAACLRVACADQIEAEQDFFHGIYGDALIRASDAFFEALVDFFPGPETRAALRQMETTARNLKRRTEELAIPKAMRILEEFDVEKEAKKLAESVGSGVES